MITITPILLAAALAVAPSDRFALADRLFNRGEYALARTEYLSLVGEKSVAADELQYRLAECERTLCETNAAKERFTRFLAEYPMSRHADRVRLNLALAERGEERVRALRMLDSDRVAPALRAEALFRLGEATGEAGYYERAAKCDPAGRFHAHAILRRAAILAGSSRDDERRQAVSLFLEVAFGKDRTLAENSLYLAATTSFASRQYAESGSLARRYIKNYPEAAHAKDCLEMSVWSDYLSGHYTDAVVRCGDAASDDLAYVRSAATLALGDEKKARELFNAYLAAWPQGRYRGECELALARLDRAAYERAGDFGKTVESAQLALKLSDSAADRMRLGWAYEQANRSDDALDCYRQVAERDPGSADAALAMYLAAMIELRAGRWAAAELALQEALAGPLETRYRNEALYWRGMAAVRLGHAEEGVKSLRQALSGTLSLDHSREARLTIADLDFNGGRTNEAIHAYSELVRDGATVRMSAAKIYAVGRLLAAPEKKLCAEALTKSESAEWRQAGFALLSEAEASLGNLAAEYAAMEKCAAERCETEALAKIAVKLGRYKSKYGDYAGAEAILKKAVALNAKDNDARAEAYLALSGNALSKGDKEAAKGYATVVVTLFENTPHASGAAAILKMLEAK